MIHIIKSNNQIEVYDSAYGNTGKWYNIPLSGLRLECAGNTIDLVSPTGIVLHSFAINNVKLYYSRADYDASSPVTFANDQVDTLRRDLADFLLGSGVTGGKASKVSASLTRPNDTTAYAANDVISDSTSAPTYLTFSNVASTPGGSGFIVKLRGMTDQKTFTGKIRLHLFHTAPTAVNDNSPYPLLWANRANRVGQIDLSAFATEDSSSSTAAHSNNYDIRQIFQCASGSRDLYGIIETLSAFTPAAQQNFFFELSADNN